MLNVASFCELCITLARLSVLNIIRCKSLVLTVVMCK